MPTRRPPRRQSRATPIPVRVIARLIGAANRDPARFARPDAFDPGRADAAHVTLGGGLHR